MNNQVTTVEYPLLDGGFGIWIIESLMDPL